jgi:hypothetical protein
MGKKYEPQLHSLTDRREYIIKYPKCAAFIMIKKVIWSAHETRKPHDLYPVGWSYIGQLLDLFVCIVCVHNKRDG